MANGTWSSSEDTHAGTAARSITAIQKQQIYIPAQYANLLTGFPTAETLIRSLIPAQTSAESMERPLITPTLPMCHHIHGPMLRFWLQRAFIIFCGGSNNYRAPVLLQGHLNENSPLWWEGPDGQEVAALVFAHLPADADVIRPAPAAVTQDDDSLPLFLQHV